MTTFLDTMGYIVMVSILVAPLVWFGLYFVAEVFRADSIDAVHIYTVTHLPTSQSGNPNSDIELPRVA